MLKRAVVFLKLRYDCIDGNLVRHAMKIISPRAKTYAYTIFHTDREIRKGGRVALYVRNALSYCPNNNIMTDNRIQTLWMNIKEGFSVLATESYR